MSQSDRLQYFKDKDFKAVKDQVKVVLEAIDEWADERQEDYKHPLTTDLANIDYHVSRLASFIYDVGQLIAEARYEEEVLEAEMNHRESWVFLNCGTDKSTYAKQHVRQDGQYQQCLMRYLAKKRDRRSLEALMEALKTKENSMPGAQGAANALTRANSL